MSRDLISYETTPANQDFVIFPWNENFATGIALIDEQHKTLVAILNKLANHFVSESSTPDNLKSVIQELSDYADFHFKAEEEIWHKHFSGTSFLAVHEHAHHEFFEKIKSIQTTSGCVEDFADELFGYLTRWLAFHILDNDKRMALASLSMDQGTDMDGAFAAANQEMTGALANLIRAVLDMYGELSASTIELMKQKIARQRLEQALRDTAEQLAAQQLAASEERYHILINAIPDAIVLAEVPSGNIVDANRAAEVLTGHSLAHLCTMKVLDLHPPVTREFHLQKLTELGASNSPWDRFETIVNTASGQMIDVEISIHGPLIMMGQTCAVGVFRDITERKKYSLQLEHVAFFDDLTGLLNRNGIKRLLDLQLKKSFENMLIVHLDIDDFSSINIDYGAEFGDKLLRAFANEANNKLPAGAYMGRLGGDEFLLFIEKAPAFNTLDQFLAESLSVMQGPLSVDNIEIRFSLSAGVKYRSNDEGSSSEALLRQAAHALYLAKIRGKSQFHILDQSQENAERKRHTLLKEIERGLAHNEFELFYQAKINMLSGEVVGAEALIRWQHPGNGLLTPGAFMPATENHAISLLIDNWVILKAAEQLHTWRKQWPALKISVNISALSLQDPGFPKRLMAILQRSANAGAEGFEIEVLESSALGDINTAISNLEQIRRSGIKVAIDDFGTGYSSLSYLKRLPIDYLKIDQSFVRDMIDSKDDIAIIQSFINISKVFELDTIAEGVETTEQRNMLLDMGCQYAQGYLISRPLPVAAFEHWMDKKQTL
ncbi:MAG: EAL domain-containing protein [Pseudohongiella sp.]|nr:EAL domain-containing protein [Pseudohongiella sp.]